MKFHFNNFCSPWKKKFNIVTCFVLYYVKGEFRNLRIFPNIGNFFKINYFNLIL